MLKITLTLRVPKSRWQKLHLQLFKKNFVQAVILRIQNKRAENVDPDVTDLWHLQSQLFSFLVHYGLKKKKKKKKQKIINME